MQGVISDYQRLAPKLRAATLCGQDFNRTNAEQRRDATAHQEGSTEHQNLFV
jgi:hypothetical protein